jgi:hypothetical protein
VTSHALLVICGFQPRPKKILLIKGFAMTTHTTGRLLGYRAVMMACLANGTLSTVKIIGQSIVFNVPHK